MKLPTFLTTVTTVSKILALILFVSLPILGFYAGMEYKKSIDPLQGADPRTEIFQTKKECESFTDRTCVPTICESNPQHESCVINSQTGWYATRMEIVPSSQPEQPIPSNQSLCEQQGGTWQSEFSECEGVNPQQCEQIGGTYDECASPCRHDPNAEMCILMCVGVCTVPDESPQNQNITIDPDHQSCTTDADCAVAVDSCMGCSCGTPINAAYEQLYENEYARICTDYQGPLCDFLCEAPNVACVDNICTLVQ
ncbi:MAG: hypothetical protein NUV98_02385 [Candidatus Roizmanbacteria bacterium]|nr:hypothetical protein [Candidatus Roizmanbacteria bacterium]